MEPDRRADLISILRNTTVWVRENLSAPLVLLCLVLAAFSEGAARAVYILGACVLCFSLMRFRAVLNEITILKTNLNELKESLSLRVSSLAEDVGALRARVVNVEDSISKIDEQVLLIKSSIEDRPHHGRAIGALLCLMLIIVVANILVFFFFRAHLVTLGQKMGDLFAQVQSSSELARRAIQISEGAKVSSQREKSRRPGETSPVDGGVEGRAMPRIVVVTPSPEAKQENQAGTAEVVTPEGGHAFFSYSTPKAPTPTLTATPGRVATSAASPDLSRGAPAKRQVEAGAGTPVGRVRSGVFEIKPEITVKSDGIESAYQVGGVRVIQPGPFNSTASTPKSK